MRKTARAEVPQEPAVAPDAPGSSRRSFLRSSGEYATGVAALVGVPTAALLDSDADAAVPAATVVANPAGVPPVSPVMAFVQDAKKGTVVIMAGTTERTVEDRELVRRLLVVPTKPKKKKKQAKPKPKPKPKRPVPSTKKGG